MDEPSTRFLSRRALLGRASTVAAGTVTLAGATGVANAASPNENATESAIPAHQPPPTLGPVRITPGDIRYDSLLRGDNFRFVGHPSEVRVVTSTDDVVHVSAPGAPGTGLYAILEIGNIHNGLFHLVVQADGALPDVEGQVDELFKALCASTSVKPFFHQGGYMPWLHMTTWPGDGEGGDKLTRRYKLKAAYLKKSYTDEHLAAIHAGLADQSAPDDAAMLLIGYGGQVQAVAPDATAVAQRDVLMKAVFSTTWFAESDDAAHLQWMREYYRAIYAATGGVPVPDDVSDGSYINYPDVDLADPAWNTSGVPWHELYYKDNYPRLQQVKAKWDPRDVFRHALSIELPA